MLLHGSINEILDGAREVSLRGILIMNADTLCQLRLAKVVVYRATCEVLEGDSRLTEAIGCFREMQSQLAQDTDSDNEQARWELGEWSR